MINDENIDLSIIIVTWNVEKYIRKCVESIQAFCKISHEIIIVDNVSSDSTLDVLDKFTDNPHFKIIKNDENIGFSRANNIGLKEAVGEYVLFLNPDVEIIEDVFTNALNTLKKNSTIGIVTPCILNYDGTRQSFYSSFPDNWITIILQELSVGKLCTKKIKKKWAQCFLNEPCNTFVDWTIGAAQFVRKADILKIGGYPTDYFMYIEDMDLCKSMLLNCNGKNYIIKEKLIHYGGASESQAISNFKINNIAVGMTTYYKKHFDIKKGRKLMQAYCMTVHVKMILGLLNGSSNKYKVLLRNLEKEIDRWCDRCED